VAGRPADSRDPQSQTKFASSMEYGAMQSVYQQKILDVRTKDTYRHEIFFADSTSAEQAASPVPIGADSKLYVVEKMIGDLIRVARGLPEAMQQIVSINVSNTILVDSDILGILLENLQDLPYGLSIEVTQLGDLPEPRKLNAVFSTLRQRNCSVEFDNFGGPNSQNTQVLSEYAFDSVKLNGRFVDNALADDRRLRLLALLTDLIRTQGKLLIATGVATCQQSEKLAALGIVLQQGDFIHSPELVN
jgi:EAL domain-containing protein (putative c-di-GMP-specific phosphodiesterase class I)